MTTPFPFVAGAVLAGLRTQRDYDAPDQRPDSELHARRRRCRQARRHEQVATANTVTVDDSIFAAGDTVEVLNKGAGATTLSAGAGVTLNGLSLVLLQYQSASVVFLSASSALVFPSGGSVKTTKVEAFAASGTFTPPAGVTFAIAHIRAGGGGTGTGSSGTGGTSSVAFAGGTISATGGLGINSSTNSSGSQQPGTVNSGQGAAFGYKDPGGAAGWASNAFDGAYIVAGGAVTPSTGITVTVGAGGTAGTTGAAGGSGYVWIEYQE
jgi:hypothetical protein